MNLITGVLLIVVYLIGLAGSVTWAISLGATNLLGFLLWTSFFGFCSAVGFSLFWSREHWLP